MMMENNENVINNGEETERYEINRESVKDVFIKALEEYSKCSLEDLHKHLTDDIRIYQRLGLPKLSEIARETRDTFTTSGVRDFSKYKKYVDENFEEVFEAFKKFMEE